MNKLDCSLPPFGSRGARRPPSETMRAEEEVPGLIRKTPGRELHDTHLQMQGGLQSCVSELKVSAGTMM